MPTSRSNIGSGPAAAPLDLSSGSALSVELRLALTYLEPEDTALTAALTEALGTPDVNTGFEGEWGTEWYELTFTEAEIADLVRGVIGVLNPLVHELVITWPPSQIR